MIPKELLDPENAEAARVSEDVLKELGGGDVVKGRQIVERDIERLRRIKEANKHLKDGGNAKALAHLADQAKWPEMLTEYWLNAILSGPITHMVNMTSNSLNTLFLPMEQALGKLSSFDLQGAGEAVGMYVHLWSSFTDAAKAAGDAWRTSSVKIDEGMGKFDTPRSTRRALRSDKYPTLNFFGAIANYPSRALLTEDAFFKNLNYRATVRQGLAKEGVAAGKTGEALASHIEEGMQKIINDGQFYEYKAVRTKAEELAQTATRGIKDPIEKQKRMKRFVRRYMSNNWKDGWNKRKTKYNTLGDYSLLAQKARQYGREVTYTQSLDEPGRAAGVQVAAGWNRVVNNHPFLRIVTPFVRTPTNLISFFLNRSIGATFDVGRFGYRHSMKHMGLLDKEMVDALTKSSPEFADAKGRFLTGSLFMFGAGVAFNNGTITGGGPKDPEKRRMMQAQGWQPYSIRVGDKWVSYQRMDPFANFIGVVADIAEGMRESDEEDIPMWESILGNTLASLSKNIASKSYLTGIARVSNVLANPDRYAQSYWEQTVASFLPFSSMAGQTWGRQEHQKELRGVLDAMRAKYGLEGAGDLGFETAVEDRRNVFGDKVERPSVALGITPFFYTDIKDDMVLKELSALGHGFSAPKKVTGGVNTTQYHNSSGQSFYDRWQEQHGKVRYRGRTIKQAIKDLIKSARYQNLPEDNYQGMKSPRIEEIQKIVRRYRSLALDATLREFPEVNRLYNRNNTIKQLRRAGRDVQSLLDY